MNLSALSIRHPGVLCVALLTAFLFGLIAIAKLPRQEDPLLTWRLANIVTRQPGASPERVEALITDVLEKYVEQVDEVEHVYSVSRAGVSLVQVELTDAVTFADPVWQKVRRKLDEASGELPEGVVGPDLDDEIMGAFALVIGVVGDGASYRQLKDAAQQIENALRYLPATASTSLFGLQEEVIRVEPDPRKLASYGLTMGRIADVISSRNVRRPSGRVVVDQTELLIETSGEFEREEDIADAVLMVSPSRRFIRVRDVAEIRRTTSSPPNPLVRVNGVRGVAVGARARPDVRVDVYGESAMDAAVEVAKSFPPGIELSIVHDLPRYTRERDAYLTRTLLLSMALVWLASALFMGPRAALVVSASLPLTGLVVLAVFLALGVPLNQMSVMAIIMAMGLLVDNAIVVAEQIQRKVRQGEELPVAAAAEPMRLFPPLLVSTLTTVVAFLPIYLLPGGTGEFVRAIPIGVGICLGASLLLAMTAVPWLCRLLLRRRPANSGEAAQPGIAERVYRQALRLTLARPALFLAICVVLLAGSASVALKLRRDFFSPVQRDQFVVDVFGPQGCDIHHILQATAQVEELAAADPQIQNVAAFVGRNAPLVFYNLTSQETYANNFAQLLVQVDDWRHTAAAASRLQRQLDQSIAGADCAVRVLEHGAPLIAPLEIRISGASIPVLQEAGRRARQILRESPAVRNVRTNYGGEALKLAADVNELTAREIGIDQGMVADELRARLDGLTASQLREGDERIAINVRLADADRLDLADLNQIYFKPTPDARLIPLATVAQLRPSWEQASIYRRDGERTLSVLAYPEFGVTAAQAGAALASLLENLAKQLPASYRLEVGGESEQRREAEGNLLAKAPYAVCIIVLLLALEFRSVRLAILILAVAPLSVGGVMVGLWATGWPLNFMAMMGMIMLLGIVVNDAVILVDGYEMRRRGGASTATAVVEGTIDRMHHVLITSVTTIAGFLPLAIAPSLLWPPLAIAVIGGLTAATAVTLIAIPSGYALLMGRGEGR